MDALTSLFESVAMFNLRIHPCNSSLIAHVHTLKWWYEYMQHLYVYVTSFNGRIRKKIIKGLKKSCTVFWEIYFCWFFVVP